MTGIDVIGGVYGESCAFPHWEEIFGSAGRAAAGLAPFFDDVRLHTILPNSQAKQAELNLGAFGVDVLARQGQQFIGFDYLHCLADPLITPSVSAIAPQPTFHVDADIAIVFGMMEATPTVSAKTCVYDPQSPTSPQRFSATGSKAKRLAIVANAREIELMSGDGVDQGAPDLLRSESAEIVIAKSGLDGAKIFDATGLIGVVPAYKTENVFTVGSGDVFVAAFTLAWAQLQMHPLDAADYASKATAQYVESSSLPIISPSDAASVQRDPVSLAGGEIYLAGPFRELGQRALINEAHHWLRSLGMTVFSPVHDIGHGPADQVVKQDLAALDRCDAVLAILNGSSPGTVFEVGYAIAKEKPTFCVAQNMRDNDLKLPHGAGALIHRDFISALHLVAWRTS